MLAQLIQLALWIRFARLRLVRHPAASGRCERAVSCYPWPDGMTSPACRAPKGSRGRDTAGVSPGDDHVVIADGLLSDVRLYQTDATAPPTHPACQRRFAKPINRRIEHEVLQV